MSSQESKLYIAPSMEQHAYFSNEDGVGEIMARGFIEGLRQTIGPVRILKTEIIQRYGEQTLWLTWQPLAKRHAQ